MHATSTATTAEGVLRIEVDYVRVDGDFRMVERWFFLNDQPISEDEVSLLAQRYLEAQANGTAASSSR